MFTALDETLFHQVAEVMGQSPVSDHRFFDRVVIGMHAPDGSLGLVTSFGVYKNNNVMDGFAMLQSGGQRQFNHRYSRSLWPKMGEPDLRTVLGPLSHEILEPMHKLRIQLQPGDYPGSYDIVWENILPPHLEGRHISRMDGRLVRDHLRMSQHGRVSGWIRLKGDKTEFKDWFAWRDHSWGVRTGVGGYEPSTGGQVDGGIQATVPITEGYLGLYLWWATAEHGSIFQLQETGSGRRLYIDGEVRSRTGAHPPLKIVDVEHHHTFFPGTRIFKTGRVVLKTEDGQSWDVAVENVGRPWAYKGSGYDSGYNDERGLGMWRAEWLEEYDEYDLSDPEVVELPDGRKLRPLHREQIAKVTVNGKPGQSHSPFITVGPNHRYKFDL
jgi:hypothetical protein